MRSEYNTEYRRIAAQAWYRCRNGKVDDGLPGEVLVDLISWENASDHLLPLFCLACRCLLVSSNGGAHERFTLAWILY